ncbi:class I histocompatibility antigen, F10 alpha chain-like [Heteronotia binoei]|uniref:class I histocompatibility antigen, F10 alpha chain-like n=1 Tax=Heteronotia binoei TaxID=13085 RepID=UPI00292F84D2|nr:class I histocompatibility antigen, F10 alpha chain-like [Heteronotia binoei]
MGLLPPRGLLLLEGVAFLLLAVRGSGSTSSHFVRYFYMALSEPGPGLPQFIAGGYLDDQPINRYDSISRRNVPQTSWMEKLEDYAAGYWKEQSWKLQGNELMFRESLVRLRDRFNQKNSTDPVCDDFFFKISVGTKLVFMSQSHKAFSVSQDLAEDHHRCLDTYHNSDSGDRPSTHKHPVSGSLIIFRVSLAGLHMLQAMYGCDVRPEGQFGGGLYQYAYDGEDFISLDMKTVTWTAPMPQAKETMRRWENEIYSAQRWKSYLEEACVEWLQRYLDYGKETLLRTEAPMARVARKKGHDGQETLFCQLYGFYPKEIEVAWMKDGEDQKPETYSGGVVPNSDGTFHTWLSIEVDPKERDRYQCQVGHDSLPEPLDLAWEEPAPSLGLILGLLGGALAVAILVIFYMKKQKEKSYEASSSELCPFLSGVFPATQKTEAGCGGLLKEMP